MSDVALDTLASRLDALEASNRRLEKSNRRWRRLSFAGIVLSGALALFGLNTATEVEAQQARYGASEYSLYSNIGFRRGIWVALNDGSTGMAMYDMLRPRLATSVYSDGQPRVLLFDSLGTARLELGVDASGNAGILIRNGAGQVVWSAP